MVFNVSLLNTQYYKERIKGKWCNPLRLVVVANEKGASRSPSTMVGLLA